MEKALEEPDLDHNIGGKTGAGCLDFTLGMGKM